MARRALFLRFSVDDRCAVDDVVGVASDEREPDRKGTSMTNAKRCATTARENREFVAGYLECAIWASTVGEDGQPLDETHDVDDLSGESRRAMIRECLDFLSYANVRDLLDSLDDSGLSRGDWSFHGHDFWLTRNGHGTGFWDRGYGRIGDELSGHAKTFGSSDLYVGDDGKVWCS